MDMLYLKNKKQRKKLKSFTHKVIKLFSLVSWK